MVNYPLNNSYGLCFINIVESRGAKLSYIPAFHFVGAFYLINIHADCILNIRRRLAGVWLEVFKYNAGPVRIILQKLQGFGHQMAFTGSCLKFVQV